MILFVNIVKILVGVFLAGSTLVSGSFIPAGQVEVCSQLNDTLTCRNKFLIIGYVTDTSVDWSVQFVLNANSTYEDQYKNVWQLNQPIYLSVQAQNQRIEYGLTPLAVNKNSYQTLSNYYDIGFCPNNAYCCNGQSGRWAFKFNQNSTDYYTFTIKPPKFMFNVVITATQESIVRQLTLNESLLRASLPAVDASVLLAVPNTLLVDFGLYYNLISTPDAQFSEGFLVPKSAMSSGVNKIGVTYQSYYQKLSVENVNCVPIVDGYYFAVNGGPAYDQFATFRNARASNSLPNCLYSTSRSSLAYSNSARESFLCRDAGVTEVLLELDASEYKLVKLYGVPVITGKGLFQFSYQDSFAHFYVDVSNRAMTNAAFTFANTRCCFVINSAIECNLNAPFDTRVTAVTPLDTVRTLLPSPAIYFISAAGLCEFTLSQHGEQSLRFNITFDTSSWFQTNQPSTEECQPPYAQIIVDGITYCQSPCTIDQIWNSSIAQCQAVNCLQKYLGAKSWYNKTTGRCEPAVVCLEGIYDAVNNLCIDNNRIPTSPFGIDPNMTFPPSNAAPAALNCGPHGVPMGDVCQCNDGWTTPQSGPQVKKEDIPWCTEFAQTQLVNVQGEDEVNPLVVILVCGLIFLFLVCCISCCVCCVKKCCCCCKPCLKVRNKLKQSSLGNKLRKLKVKRRKKKIKRAASTDLEK